MTEGKERKSAEVCLVAVLAALPYLGVLGAPFVFDDVKLVRDNPEIRDLSGIPRTFNIFSQDWQAREVRANYRPLRFLSYAIDYRITRWLFGESNSRSLRPEVFHATNILLHAANAVLVLWIGRALLGDRRSALALGLLFAVHPLATEAVTYISGRRDVLSTACFLLALLVHLRASRWAAVPAVWLLFACGLLSKEMAVTLPGAALLCDLARRAPFGAPRAVSLAGLWAMGIAFAVSQGGREDLVAGAAGGSTASVLLTAPRYVARYLSLLLFPWPQSLDYSFDAIPPSSGLLSPWTTLPSLLLFLALLALGLGALLRGNLAPAAGVLWFLGTLLPVLQLVPIPERFAERFAYLPGIGVLLLGAALFGRLRPRAPRVAWGSLGAALAALALGTTLRNREWLSPRALWESAVRAQPRAARAHLALGDALKDGGGWRDAARAYSRALAIFSERLPEGLPGGDPASARGDDLLHWGYMLQARASRAGCHGRLGPESAEHYQAAVEDYRWLLGQRDIDGTAIAESSSYISLRYDLAGCLLGLSQAERDPSRARGLRAEAAGEYRRVAGAEKAQPSLARNSHYYLHKIAGAEGRAEEALRELEEAYRIACASGGPLDRYGLVGELADLLIARKEYARADDRLAAVARELGRREEQKHLLYRRARIADRKGDPGAAAGLLEDALSLDRGFGPALLSLAVLEEGRGNLERAEELYRRVLEVAPGEDRARRGLEAIRIRRDLAREDKSSPEEAAAAKAASGRAILEGLIARGEGHLQRREYFAAAKPLRRAALDPSGGAEGTRNRDLRALALRGLGAVARALGELSEAEAYLSAAIATDPGCRDAWKDLGDLQLRNLKSHEAAARAYDEYLQCFPPGELGEAYVYRNLAGLVQEREPDRAVELLRAAQRAGFQEPLVDRNLGQLLSRLGRWEEAFESFQTYLERSEEAERAHPEKGRADAVERERVRQFLRQEVMPRLEEGAALPEASGRARPAPPRARGAPGEKER